MIICWKHGHRSIVLLFCWKRKWKQKNRRAILELTLILSSLLRETDKKTDGKTGSERKKQPNTKTRSFRRAKSGKSNAAVIAARWRISVKLYHYIVGFSFFCAENSLPLCMTAILIEITHKGRIKRKKTNIEHKMRKMKIFFSLAYYVFYTLFLLVFSLTRLISLADLSFSVTFDFYTCTFAIVRTTVECCCSHYICAFPYYYFGTRFLWAWKFR